MTCLFQLNPTMSGEISLREVKSLRDEICYAGERLVGISFAITDYYFVDYNLQILRFGIII